MVTLLLIVCSSALAQPQLPPVAARESTGQELRGPAPPLSDNPCFIPFRQSRSYATWICDDEATQYVADAELFAFRRTHGGGYASQLVWRGPLETLSEEIGGVIQRHLDINAHCRTYFHVAALSGGETQWNRVTANMQKWWDTDGAEHYPTFCYSSEPAWADYVVFWSDSVNTIPYRFVVPLPQTTTVFGSAAIAGPSGSTFANFSGTATSSQMHVFAGTRGEWNVEAALLPVEWRDQLPRLGTPLNWLRDVGRWRWSKPDKDVVVDALSYLEDRFDGSEWPVSFGEVVSFASAPSTSAPQTTASASSVIVMNDEVVRMVQAGIGNEVIIQKIQTSVTDFRLAIDDLIELKQAGVPDTILTVMLEAATEPSQAVTPSLSEAVRALLDGADSGGGVTGDGVGEFPDVPNLGLGRWGVVHDHVSSQFQYSCDGDLFVSSEGLMFVAEDSGHSFDVPWDQVEIAARPGWGQTAFSVAVGDGRKRTYNLKLAAAGSVWDLIELVDSLQH